MEGEDLAPDFDADLHYTVAGGVHYVYTDHAVAWTLTEPVNGGATTVTINPTTVSLISPDAFTATVTNTFAVPAIQPNFTG